MNFSTLLLSLFFVTQLCAQQELPAPVGPALEFETRHIDLGTVKHGDSKDMVFRFTNTGTEDLKIEIVSSCECTTLDYPRLPIKPGEIAEIAAHFDSTEKEKSETVDVDIYFENEDPSTGYGLFEIVSYSYELLK